MTGLISNHHDRKGNREMAKGIDPRTILRRVEEEGFEKVWSESTDLIPTPKKRQEIKAGKPGSPHPLFELAQKMRKEQRGV